MDFKIDDEALLWQLSKLLGSWTKNSLCSIHNLKAWSWEGILSFIGRGLRGQRDGWEVRTENTPKQELSSASTLPEVKWEDGRGSLQKAVKRNNGHSRHAGPFETANKCGTKEQSWCV